MKVAKIVVVAMLVASAMFAITGCSTEPDFIDSWEKKANTSSETLDISKINEGTITAHTDSDVKSKLLVENKTTGEEAHYQLPEDHSEIVVPVNLGNGEYAVHIMEYTGQDTRYKSVEKKTATVNFEDENTPYLASTSYCEYEDDSAYVERAAYLISDLNTDEEKVEAITDWVAENISYDNAKAKVLSAEYDYYPSAKDTHINKTGICYDYAALTAAMLRSQGIPTKIQVGTALNNGEYHSWNEALIDGQWTTIDTTYASANHCSAFTDSSDYSIEKTL